MKFLFLVLLLSFFLNPVDLIAAEPWRTPHSECASRFLKLTNRFQPHQSLQQRWESLSLKPRFLAFLTNRKLDPYQLSQADQERLLEEYHEEFFKTYRTPELLKSEQDRSLVHALGLRGVVAQKGKGRRTLEETSHRNLMRIFSEKPIVKMDLQESQELKEIVDRFEFYFSHNTNVLRELPDDPVLSSKRLEEYGLQGGRNTLPFNKQLMETDDQVYFNLRFRRKGDPRVATPTSYGKTQLVLDPDYAKSAGMVSHFIMYPYELLEFGALHFPERYSPYFHEYEKSLLMPKEITQEKLKEIRERLSISDFTVEDFQSLVRTYAMDELHQMKSKNPARFAQFKKMEAEWLSPEKLDRWIREEVLRPRGLSLQWELKVPVAVPVEALGIVKKQ